VTKAWNPDEARSIIAAKTAMPGALLPILHALMEHFGCVDAAATPIIAEALNLSQAEVHGVIGFYHDFRRSPPGRHIVKLCRAEACQAAGHAEVLSAAAHAGAHLGATSADGRITVEPVYCLGLCAVAPAALIDGRPVGRLDAARIKSELEALS
jgi:formate dehydrogenase subunit gamma